MATLAIAAVVLTAAQTSESARLHFIPEHQCEFSVVLLSDVAEIGTERKQTKSALGRIELFRAPPPGRKRELRPDDVISILSKRGVDTSGFQLSGASQITIRGRRSERTQQTRQSIPETPKEKQPPKEKPPTVSVLVATRDLQRGDIVRDGDVRLDNRLAHGLSGNELHTVEDAIGKEAARTLRASQPIASQSLRRPIVVRRGEIVTIYVRSAGVQVRTKVKALENGSRGDLVEVQSSFDRRRLTARVVDYQEVEIYANSIRAGS